MGTRNCSNRRGAASTHFVAAVLVVLIVALVGVLSIQHRAYNPRLTTHQQAVRVPRGRVPYAGNEVPDTAYAQVAQIKLEVHQPRGIALGPNGDLFVAGDKLLLKHDKAGKQLLKETLPAEAHAVCVGPDGTVYLGYRDHVELRKADGGGPVEWPKIGDSAYITSLCTDGKSVWVADAGGRRVLEYDTAGKLLRTIGERNPSKNVPGLVVPSPHLDVALDSSGSLWVANPGKHSLEKYGKDGSVVASWGKMGAGMDCFCGCCNPSDFAIGPGDVFVTVEKGVFRIKEYSKEGKLQSLVATGEEFGGGAVCNIIVPGETPASRHAKSGESLDLAVAKNGSVYVLDPTSKSVRVFKQK